MCFYFVLFWRRLVWDRLSVRWENMQISITVGNSNNFLYLLFPIKTSIFSLCTAEAIRLNYLELVIWILLFHVTLSRAERLNKSRSNISFHNVFAKHIFRSTFSFSMTVHLKRFYCSYRNIYRSSKDLLGPSWLILFLINSFINRSFLVTLDIYLNVLIPVMPIPLVCYF